MSNWSRRSSMMPQCFVSSLIESEFGSRINNLQWKILIFCKVRSLITQRLLWRTSQTPVKDNRKRNIATTRMIIYFFFFFKYHLGSWILVQKPNKCDRKCFSGLSLPPPPSRRDNDQRNTNINHKRINTVNNNMFPIFFMLAGFRADYECRLLMC